MCIDDLKVMSREYLSFLIYLCQCRSQEGENRQKGFRSRVCGVGLGR